MNNESTALSTYNGGQLAQFGEMSVQAIVDRKRKIVEVMNAVMIEGEHYGKIPGCGDKPSLFKAGAEVMATVFGLAPSLKITRTEFPNGHREYEITCTLKHIATGAVVGEGVGTCSTMESKYRWRTAQRKCPSCGATAILKSKNESEGFFCWAKKGGCGAKFSPTDKTITDQELGRVENPDIADTYNTVLKIAKKRAQVDCTLTATGASDLLTQDLEDLPPGSIVEERRAEPANGNGANSQRDTANTAAQQTRRSEPADDHDLEAVALDLIADLDECKTPEEIRALAKRVNALPKGTQARHSAWTHYNKRLADTTPGAAA